MVQILLMLKLLFTKDSAVEVLFCGASPGSEPILFFNENLFSLEFEHVQDDFQHECTWRTYKADVSVVLAESYVDI